MEEGFAEFGVEMGPGFIGLEVKVKVEVGIEDEFEVEGCAAMVLS